MKKLFFYITLLALLGGGFWYASQRGFVIPVDLPDSIKEKIESVSGTVVEKAGDITKEISTPGPLRTAIGLSGGELTRSGVLKWTNIQRSQNGGLPALIADPLLNTAAELKLQEMFSQQYFDHVSPRGEGPADKVDRSGYEYIAVGENLALGTFKDDEDLVQAWMNSPGHRANVLAGTFTQIGIAVGEGTFEGDKVWLAVQMFGKPLSACPEIDPNLQGQIELDQLELDRLKLRADALKRELDRPKKFRTQNQVDAYNLKVAEYNSLIQQINALIQKIQGQITVYNGQVQAFNTCAEG